jgi:hypothetical protein
MKRILTPVEAALLKAKKSMSSDEFFALQKVMIEGFAEGYNTGDRNYTPKKIKTAILNSRLWREVNSDLYKDENSQNLMSIFE